MNKRIKLFIIVILLVLVEATSIFLMYKSISNKPVIYNEKLDIEDNAFAIMLGDKQGVYTESENSSWPSRLKYNYNSDRSGCVDKDGNIIKNALTYNVETGVATVIVTTTAYCYLYFDLDNVAPQSFTFYLGGISNPTYTNNVNISAYLSWTDEDITKYCLTTDVNSNKCTWNNVSGTSTTVNYTLKTGDGIKTIYAYLMDVAENVSDSVIDTITLDTIAPTNNSAVINSKAAYTKSTSVTLTLASNDATEMCISNTTTCTSWEAYKTSKTHTLTTGDGTKTVYVTYRDAAGNISTRISDTIILDTVAPANNSVVINSKATYTKSTSVTLTLASSGATEMCISNTTACTSWEAYKTSKTHTLTTGDGTKTVYVTYRDAAGNISSTVSDTIILDTTPPTVSIASSSSSTNSITITISASGASTYYYKIGNGSYTSSTSTSKTFSSLSSGTNYTVYVYAVDVAGNQSEIKTTTLSTKNSYYCSVGTLDGSSCVVSASSQNWYTYSPYSCNCTTTTSCEEVTNDEWLSCMRACGGLTTGQTECGDVCDATYPSKVEECTDTETCQTCYYIYYYCGSGWSTYSGSGSSLTCYRAATLVSG